MNFKIFVLLSAVLILEVKCQMEETGTEETTANNSSCSTMKEQNLEKNKQLVLGLYSDVFGDKDFEAADKYISGDMYIEHNPMIPDGREALKMSLGKWLQGRPKEKWDIRRMSAEGDLVWAHSKINDGQRDQAVVDIFRIENNKIVEHWDVIQPIPDKSMNTHPLF